MCDIKEMYKVLWNYEYKQTNPIVIMAPDFSCRNKLRVYANGGLLGRISFGKGKTTLLNTDYDKKGLLKALVEKAIEKGTENDTFITTEYLESAIEAIEAKFQKKKTDEKVVKERYVETAIVKKYMKSNADWAVIDMEAQFPSKLFADANFSKKTTKSPKFDFVVINEKGIGIVELKVNNESCNNMQSHYEHMDYVLQHPQEFLKEFQRRIEILKKYELISEETITIYHNLLNKNEIPLWCGFLFVGGEKETTLKKVKRLGKNKNIGNLKFMYYDNFDISELNINDMVSYEEFIQ